MKTILRGSAILAFFIIQGCGFGAKESQLKNQGPVEFTQWCQDWSLQNCEQSPDNKVPTKLWLVGNELIKTVGQSPSTVELERSVFDSNAIQNLLATLGPEVSDYFNQLPWTRLANNSNVLYIENDQTETFNINGLVITLAPEVSIEVADSGIILLDGITLNSADGSQSLTLKTINMQNDNAIHFSGTELEVRNIAPAFFLTFLKDIGSPDILDLISGFEGILFNNEFNWRELASIRIDEAGLNELANSVDGILGDSAEEQALKTVLGNLSGIQLGGTDLGSDVARVLSSASTQCSARVQDVPVIGSTTVRITLKNSLGLKDLTDTNTGFSFKIFGVSTNFGDVKQVTLDGTKLKVKIGWITIPIDLAGAGEPGEPGGESPISELQCS